MYDLTIIVIYLFILNRLRYNDRICINIYRVNISFEHLLEKKYFIWAMSGMRMTLSHVSIYRIWKLLMCLGAMEFLMFWGYEWYTLTWLKFYEDNNILKPTP